MTKVTTGADAHVRSQDYRYARTRSAPVLALALIASAGAFGLVYSAWNALDTATQQDRLAEPPNLKAVVAKVKTESAAQLESAEAAVRD